MMDTAEYMPMFLAEAQEHLQELNLAVVRLEENPGDRETVDEIFRIAHSLKGMSATMGFAAIAALTHEMEDVFELLRQRQEALSRRAVDTVLACLDTLAAAVEAIEVTGSEQLDPGELIAQLRDLVRVRSEEQQAERAGGRVHPDLDGLIAEGIRALHVCIDLDPDVLMPSVRAHMILAALCDHGELIGSSPAPESVEQFDGRRVEGWLICDHEESLVAAALTAVSDVAQVQLTEIVDPSLDSTSEPGPAAADAPASQCDRPPAREPDKAAGPASPADVRAAARTVRVDSERLDALMHSMGELVIQRTAVEAIAGGLNAPDLHHAVQELTRTSQALQAMVMQVRMIPVEAVFLRFPRLVRDLSSKLGKQVRLDLVGSDTELDRTVVDALGDPLVHLVRNALDHGLELAQDRENAGKDPTGTLQIVARHAGGSVVIEVRDDGRGIDAAAVAQKAAESGLIDPAAVADVDLRAAVELLFAPGFSTAETTSDISGRGVGMDAVRAKIRELGGEVLIDSTPGQGTLAQIRLPLTLAIVSGLLVTVSSAPYAIPLDRVERTLRLSEGNTQSIAGEQLLMLGDGVLPLIDAARAFGRAPGPRQFAVIIRSSEERVALAVDQLIGQRELVTRPLPGVVSGTEPVAGGTALPDGQIALIVDCDALAPPSSPRNRANAQIRPRVPTTVGA